MRNATQGPEKLINLDIYKINIVHKTEIFCNLINFNKLSFKAHKVSRAKKIIYLLTDYHTFDQ